MPPKKVLKKIPAIKKTPPGRLEPRLQPVGRILEMRPAAQKPNGISFAAALILILFSVGLLSVAALMAQKLRTMVLISQSALYNLKISEQKNLELTEQINSIRTLQDLAGRVAATAPDFSQQVWENYSSPNLTMQYPYGFETVKASSSFPGLTIKNNQGRIEIFRMKDFPGGERTLDFMNAETTSADFDNLVPKDFLTVPSESPAIAPYSVWVYYGNGDEQTKSLLLETVKSIKILK
jgi:hypothetical protein